MWLKIDHCKGKTGKTRKESRQGGFYQTEFRSHRVRIQLGILCEWRMNNRRFCTPTKSAIWWSLISRRSESSTDWFWLGGYWLGDSFFIHKILNSWVVLLLIIHSSVRFSSLVSLSTLSTKSCPQDNVKNLHLSDPSSPSPHELRCTHISRQDAKRYPIPLNPP